MSRADAEVIVSDLTAEALDDDEDDRLTIIPANYNGRQYRPYGKQDAVEMGNCGDLRRHEIGNPPPVHGSFFCKD